MRQADYAIPESDLYFAANVAVTMHGAGAAAVVEAAIADCQAQDLPELVTAWQTVARVVGELERGRTPISIALH